MKRRTFLSLSAGGFAGSLALVKQKAYGAAERTLTAGRPKPLPAITMMADAILPADPQIPNDFKATDYGADIYVAERLGYLGQLLAVIYLSVYSWKTSRKLFTACTPEEQTDALRAWMADREGLSPLIWDMMLGLYSFTLVGAFEGLPQDMQNELFESMRWYDPAEPRASFRIPCDGYSNLNT